MDSEGEEKETGQVPAFERLMVEYNEAVRGIEEEKGNLELALDRLRQAQAELAPISEAKLRELTRDFDVQLSLGNVAKAKAKKVEVEKIKNHALNLSREIEQTAQRLEKLEQQRVQVANQTLADLYPHLQHECLKRLAELIDFFESTWEDLQEFGTQTGATVRSFHLRNLTPALTGKDRFLWEKARKWLM